MRLFFWDRNDPQLVLHSCCCFWKGLFFCQGNHGGGSQFYSDQESVSFRSWDLEDRRTQPNTTTNVECGFLPLKFIPVDKIQTYELKKKQKQIDCLCKTFLNFINFLLPLCSQDNLSLITLTWKRHTGYCCEDKSKEHSARNPCFRPTFENIEAFGHDYHRSSCHKTSSFILASFVPLCGIVFSVSNIWKSRSEIWRPSKNFAFLKISQAV